jgi:hypothetical protein
VISARVREPGSRETTASGALAAQGLYGVVSRSVLVRALQQGIRGHDLGTFVDEPPTIAQGGRGSIIPDAIRTGKDWPVMSDSLCRERNQSGLNQAGNRSQWLALFLPNSVGWITL